MDTWIECASLVCHPTLRKSYWIHVEKAELREREKVRTRRIVWESFGNKGFHSANEKSPDTRDTVDKIESQ